MLTLPLRPHPPFFSMDILRSYLVSKKKKKEKKKKEKGCYTDGITLYAQSPLFQHAAALCLTYSAPLLASIHTIRCTL